MNDKAVSLLLPIVLLDGTMFEELNEAQESPRSRIAQLTYENQNFKELTTESAKQLKEFEECRRELEMKEKHIRHLWRKTNCSHGQTVHIFFIYVLIIILLLLPIMHLMHIYIYIYIYIFLYYFHVVSARRY